MSDKQGAPTLPPLTGGGGNNGGSNGGAPQQTVSLQQVFANVLSSANVQQFVLASQVPGLTQVLPSGGSTNQPIGVTRIVNLAGTAPRVSVVNVAGSSTGTSLTSSSRQNPKLVLTTSPKLVRTSIANMFVAPTSQASTATSVQSPPAKKKSRLSEGGTEKPTSVESDPMGYRRRIMEHKLKRMRAIRDKYNDNASELFFLHNGGNLIDYHTWKKRPPTAQFVHFMKQQRLDGDEDEEEQQLLQQNVASTATTEVAAAVVAPAVTTTTTTTATTTNNPTSATTAITTTTMAASTVTAAATTTTATTTTVTVAVTTTTTTTSTVVASVATTSNQSTEVAVSGLGGTPVAVSTTLPPAVAQLNQQGGTPIVIDSSKSSSTSTSNPVVDKAPTSNPVEKPATPPITSAQPVVKLVKLPASSIASPCDTVSNQEQIVEKAKQEAYVMQRIAELQREGLWSERRLPKVQEPARPKAHWDYLLEEMFWLSTDFAQERKWKKSAAKKCARMVQKYFQEKAIQAQKAEKLEELRLKKIASFIAKEIKTFWANVEKLVEYKQQTRLEEKRKKALDQHLNFIVDQTEKYSSWLTEGLNKTDGNQSAPPSMHSSRISSPITTGKHSDDDFKPNQCSDDDEETIAKAEEEMKSNHKEEVELLKKESELPLEDLLKELPPNYLEERDKSLSPLPREIVEEESDNTEGKDAEFTVASNESSDDEEDTIQEQEKLEKDVDHKQELDDLKAENEMSIDELMAKYGNASETPMDVDDSDDESDKEEEEENESESENETESEDETQEEDSQTQSDDETAVGLKSLLEDLSDENKSMKEATEKQNEMDSVAALAESIQPKGNTLLTTSVVTKIPFLLKHNLREYQHIGLDWLVTMYERKLNGILADEMGLGKTIQTIALLAHLACEKGNWGPHLIIVPTSVMLNWEMECKKWCPGFKILTYYGTQKERKQKRTGWTKPNAFHICITSYKLVIQDHQSFRRKKWKYLILDEAQNIKNFKSQRWQLLLNFQTQRRLLLTGTPLQNNLMELWSLMHFLMPNVFQSHREFKEWFSNPVTGMIEGNNEYNENIIRRLHKVLRPFLLRRLKCEVEKQLPKKYEHVVMCRLSKRQRYLYDDFMSRAKTKETLASGNLLSVINVLMQLRKVCNHPNLFEVRPTVSPFQMEGIDYYTASLAWSALNYDPFKHIDLSCLNLLLVDLEFTVTAFVAHRVRRLKTPRKLIEEIDSQPEIPPRCPSGKIKINVRLSNQVSKTTTATQQNQQQIKIKSFPGILPTPRVGTSPLVKTANNQTPTGQGVTLKVAGGQQLQGFSVQLVPHQGGVKAIPVGTVAQNIQSTATVTPTTTGINAQRITVGNTNVKDGAQRLTTHTYTVKHGDSVQKYQVPSFAQLVQTSTGRHIILTNPNQQTTNALSFPVMTSSGQRLTVLSKQIMGLSTTPVSVNKVIGGVVTSTAGGISNRPVMRVPPLNVSTSQSAGQVQQQSQMRCSIVPKNSQKDLEKSQTKEIPKSEFYLPQLEETKRQRRHAKLISLADMNEKRCAACPLYGEDLFTALRIGKPATGCQWHSGWIHCTSKNERMRTRRQFFSHTEALAEAIKSTEQIVEELQGIFDRFVVYVPAVRARLPRFHVSHPPPDKLWKEQRLNMELQRNLSPKMSLFHPIERSMLTQFPDPRLIQYDCGKLQSLDTLLRKLKVNSHRVLIFTQMTRMLDVLEAFLNYHGYIYLRLDGATKVDQRQVLMERFNNDKRIFCFILSTRSGGIGVNLTGADTVVFYDSDWNPTMDAQAQDRCHRIGQTRDVHIYRLISERTVEENILKKANQKRLLGDLAIEGGNFTTAYFKSSTIQDLFNVDQTETDASTRMAEVLEQNKDREKHLQKELSQSEDKMAIGALESALAAVEEDQDVQAAKTAKAEAVADLAEFDENIPVDDVDNDETQISKAEMEVQNIVSQLTPVERYAMRFVEESDGSFSAAQLAAAERELEEQKKEWELDRLRAMREEEERQMRMTDDDENPITFTREDAQNQVNNSTSNSRRLGSKRPSRPINRRGRGRQAIAQNDRRRGSRRSLRVRDEEEETTTSDSESDTTSLSETDSQDDDVAPEQENSSDEEERKSSRADSSDEEEHENVEEDNVEKENIEKENSKNKEIDGRKRLGRRRNSKKKLLDSTKNNRIDLNSPRTRSRGDVKINLWTLDVDPILPESKPRHRKSKKLNDNTLTDENLSASLAVDKDEKSDTLSESLENFETKAMDISTNSSADESTCNENEIDTSDVTTALTSTSTPLTTTITRRTTSKGASIKFILKSPEKESFLNESSIEESNTTCLNTSKVEMSKAINIQEKQNNDHKESNPTHHKVGRPRKHSHSLFTIASVEPNSVVTYTTRSSNKLSMARPAQEKRVPPLKINFKVEPKICDINDTTSNPRNEDNEENESNTTVAPVKDTVDRPNHLVASNEISEDNEKTTSTITAMTTTSTMTITAATTTATAVTTTTTTTTTTMTTSTTVTDIEKQEKFDTIEQHEKMNQSKIDLTKSKLDSSEDDRSPSPVFNTRNIKVTRSYARIRTELKDKQANIDLSPDISELKQIKTPDNVKSNSESNVEEKKSEPVPMETDNSPSTKTADDDTTSLNKISTPHRSSPVLSTRIVKITRASLRSSAETKEKHVILETKTETKENCTTLKTKEDTKSAEKIQNLETKSTLPLELESTTEKSVIEEAQNKLSKAKNITRSSVRLNSDSKLTEKNNATSETNSEQKKPVMEKLKILDTSSTPTVVLEEISQSIQKNKTFEEEQHQQIKIKITRSSARIISESLPKVSSKLVPSVNTDDTEPIKAVPEQSKSPERLTLISKQVDIDHNSKKLKIVSEKIKIPEKQTSVTKQVDTDVNLKKPKLASERSKTPEKQMPTPAKVTEEKSKSPERQPEKQKESAISPTQQKSNNEDSKLTKEQHSTAAVAENTKEITAELVPSTNSEPKIVKTGKMDPPVSGPITRRSKANCNVETSGAIVATQVNSEEKLTPTDKIKEPQIENSGVTAAVKEAKSEKQIAQTDGSVSEQARAMRSSAQLINPLCRRFQTPPKPGPRRRPDTPMPAFYSIRPMTRSLTHSNSSSSDGEGGSSSGQNQQKLSPRSTRTSVDNGFLVPSSPPVTVRRSRSTTYIKLSERRLAMEKKEIAVPVVTAKGPLKDSASVESLVINRVLAKRRPDTPLPSPEQLSRLPKSNSDAHMSTSRMLPPMPKLKQIRKIVALPPPLESSSSSNQAEQQRHHVNSAPVADNTDTNGNSLDSDVDSPSLDKQQRTAKVVAILNLESRNSGKTNQQQTSSGGSPSQKAKLLNSENVIVNSTRSSRLSRAVHGSKVSSNISVDDNSSGNSPTIATIDLDSEPEYTSTTEAAQRMSKRVKRTRFNSQIVKAAVSSSSKPSPSKEIQTIEIEDDEDEKIPLKRLNRLNPPPPASTVSSPPDKINNNPGS